MTKSSSRLGGKPTPSDKSPTEVFASRLAVVRKRRGWSQRQLSERLEQLGHALPPEQISRIETGKRGVSLDDAFALAYGLDASLLHLLVDPDAGVEGAELPRVVVVGNVQPENQADVAEWIVGDGPLNAQDGLAYAVQRPSREIAAEMEAVRALQLGEPTTPLVGALRAAFERFPELREAFGQLPPLKPDEKEENG